MPGNTAVGAVFGNGFCDSNFKILTPETPPEIGGPELGMCKSQSVISKPLRTISNQSFGSMAVFRIIGKYRAKTEIQSLYFPILVVATTILEIQDGHGDQPRTNFLHLVRIRSCISRSVFPDDKKWPNY